MHTGLDGQKGPLLPVQGWMDGGQGRCPQCGTGQTVGRAAAPSARGSALKEVPRDRPAGPPVYPPSPAATVVCGQAALAPSGTRLLDVTSQKQEQGRRHPTHRSCRPGSSTSRSASAISATRWALPRPCPPPAGPLHPVGSVVSGSCTLAWAMLPSASLEAAQLPCWPLEAVGLLPEY